MEHPPPHHLPSRWGALPFADTNGHGLEAAPPAFGGLSALRDAAVFGQEDRQPQPQSLPPSPLYYSRGDDYARSEPPAARPPPPQADPPFVFAPFPSLPLPPARDENRPPFGGQDPMGRHYSPTFGARQGESSSATTPSEYFSKPLARRADPLSPSMALSVAGGVAQLPRRPANVRRVTDEERKAKHREAQRRFVRRKKVAMVQLRELATTLEKQFELLQATGEQQRLEDENASLQDQIEDAAAESKRREDAQRESPRDVKALVPSPTPTEWEYREFEW